MRPARIVRAAQEGYLARSRPLTPEEWGRRSYLSRTLEGAAKLFSPIL